MILLEGVNITPIRNNMNVLALRMAMGWVWNEISPNQKQPALILPHLNPTQPGANFILQNPNPLRLLVYLDPNPPRPSVVIEYYKSIKGQKIIYWGATD